MNPAKLVDPVRDERHFLQQHEPALIGKEGLRYSYERALREYKQITVPQERRNFYPIIRFYEKKMFGEVKTKCAGAGRRPGKPKGVAKPKALKHNFELFTDELQEKIDLIFERYPTNKAAYQAMGYTGSNAHLGKQKTIHKRNVAAINKAYTALVEEDRLIGPQAVERVPADNKYQMMVEYITSHYGKLNRAAEAAGISKNILYKYRHRKQVRRSTYDAVEAKYNQLTQKDESHE